MRSYRIKQVLALAVLVSIAGFTQASISVALERNNDRPDLPSPLCDTVEVEHGNRLAYRAFAVGVQRYRWDGATWVFVEPVATLYADSEYHEKVGVHYAGPTWEANSGGKVVAAKVGACTPDASAIPWLRLQKTTASGPGLFGNVTFIQRLNTKGGLAPTAPGSAIGVLADIPYTAEYYFYRARD